MLIWVATAWSQEPPLRGDDEVDETVIVTGDAAVMRARDELFLSLREEGYVRHEREGDYTVFLNDVPYMPQVWLHDDGWITLKGQPPRIRSPGHSFADQGSPLNYLWCVPTLMTACVSVGTVALGPRQLQTIREDVVTATRDEVQTLSDAVIRQHLAQRLYKDIPSDLQAIWTDPALSPAERRRKLFLFWDSRTETDAGNEAKEAIRAFILGVVQSSATPFTAEELSALNGKRQSAAALVLAGS